MKPVPMSHLLPMLLASAIVLFAGGCQRKKDGAGEPTAGSSVAAGSAASGEPTATAGTGAAATPATPATPPASPQMTEAELAPKIDAWVTFMEKLGAAADRVGKDCGAIAAAIDQLVSENQAVLDESDRIRANPINAATARALVEKALPRLTPLEGKLAHCTGDARFDAAFAKTMGQVQDKPAGDPPAEVGPVLSEAEIAPMIERFLVIYEKLADAAVAAKADCGALAAKIAKLVAENATFLAEAPVVRGNSPNRTIAQALLLKERPRMHATETKMAAAMGACVDDKAVQTALARFMM